MYRAYWKRTKHTGKGPKRDRRQLCQSSQRETDKRPILGWTFILLSHSSSDLIASKLAIFSNFPLGFYRLEMSGKTSFSVSNPKSISYKAILYKKSVPPPRHFAATNVIPGDHRYVPCRLISSAIQALQRKNVFSESNSVSYSCRNKVYLLLYLGGASNRIKVRN